MSSGVNSAFHSLPAAGAWQPASAGADSPRDVQAQQLLTKFTFSMVP